MDRNSQHNTSKQQQINTSSKIYELLVNSGHPGQGLEMMMRSLENDANIIDSSNENIRNSQTHSQSNTSATESDVLSDNNMNNSTLELHPSIVLQNLGLGDEVTEDRPHICQICNATYKTRTHLRRHMFVHLSNRPYPCSECGKGFNRKEHLNKHIEAVHSGTKYKCEYCGKEISRKDHLSRHIKNMHTSMVGISVKTEPCTDDQTILKVQLPCGQKQKAQLSFIPPNYSPPNSPGSDGSVIGDTIITPIQNNYNAKPARFKTIAQQQHVPSGQSMMLPGDMMVTPTMITSTQKSSNTTRIQANNGLPASMTQISVFAQNRNSVSSNSGQGGEKKMLLQLFTCSECSATFTSEKDLTVHARIHKPQPYKCADCPRAYTRREKLTEHIRCFHQGQKFTCDYCGKELSRKDHVLRHVRSVHPEVLANRFVSSMSDSDMDGSGSGQMRPNSNPLQGNNGGNIPSIGEMGVLLRSVCHICLKVFGTSYHLSRHIESCHNGDIRPYACAACSKQFKRKDHLTKHMKSHCPSMRESSNNSRMTTGVKTSFDSMEINSSNNTNADNSAILNNLEVDLAGIHPDAIDSLQIEMMSPGGEEEENTAKRSRQSNLNKNIADTDNNDNSGEGDGGSDVNSMEDKLKYSDGIPVIVDGRENAVGKSTENSNVVDNEFSLAVMNSFLDSESQVTVDHNNPNSMKANIVHMIQVSNAVDDANSVSIQRQLRYPCGVCQKEFTSRNKLAEHLMEQCNEKLMRPLNNLQNVNQVTQSHSQQHIQQNVHQNSNINTTNNLWSQ